MDWDLIQKKGEKGKLKADEMKALILLARAAIGLRFCEWCGWEIPRHETDCPVRKLEEIKENED